MSRRGQVHMDQMFGVEKQKGLMAETKIDEALESPFQTLETFFEIG